jgi:uncharacterized protein (TIGR00645 family)
VLGGGKEAPAVGICPLWRCGRDDRLRGIEESFSHKAIDRAAKGWAASPARLQWPWPNHVKENPMLEPIGRGIQSAVLFSRWLVAPFLLGLAFSMLLILYRFFGDLFQLTIKVPTMEWHDLLVGVLDLIDLTLTANLVLIVIFSGYENYIRRVVPGENPDWPGGLVDVDFSGLKQKLLGSIAGIAAVDALAWDLDLEKHADASKLVWALAFPLMFVVAMVLVALADRLSRRPVDH